MTSLGPPGTSPSARAERAGRGPRKSQEVLGGPGSSRYSSPGIPRISQDFFRNFFICSRIVPGLLQGNLRSRRSWEVRGGPRRSQEVLGEVLGAPRRSQQVLGCPGRGPRRSQEVLGSPGRGPSFLVEAQDFLIFNRIVTRLLQGNLGPGRSWEVRGGPSTILVHSQDNPSRILVNPSNSQQFLGLPSSSQDFLRSSIGPALAPLRSARTHSGGNAPTKPQGWEGHRVPTGPGPLRYPWRKPQELRRKSQELLGNTKNYQEIPRNYSELLGITKSLLRFYYDYYQDLLGLLRITMILLGFLPGFQHRF